MRDDLQFKNVTDVAPKASSSISQPASLLRRSRQRGSSLVENAIVVTITLVLLFGVVDFGRALYSYHYISNAAREATRYASVRGYTCPATFTTACPASAADISNFVKNAPDGIDPLSLTVNSTWGSGPNNLAMCNNAATRNYPGCSIQVRVQYNFKFIFPLMPANFRMSSTSEMIISH